MKMIQKCLFTLLLIGSIQALSAQEQSMAIRYVVTHNWTKKMAAVDYISQQERERMSYIWGSRSEWSSYTNLFIDGQRSKYEESEEKFDDDDFGYNWRKDPFFISRDFEAGTFQDLLTVQGKPYLISDSIRVQDWKILNDMKEVAGHVCMNAVLYDSVKMQRVVAWFALDMPFPGGPERYYGLPGLILEVNVNNGGMVIVADKIEPKILDKELGLPKKIKGKRVNETEYQEVLKKFVADKRKAEESPFWGIRY